MRRNLSAWPCSVARAADVLGDAWTLVILRDSFHGVTKFDDFHKSLGIARNTLSDRLTNLVEAGVLTKEFYQDNPPRYEYLLTEMGHDLFPAIAALLAWGDRWLGNGDGPPVGLYHRPCGHDAQVDVVCGHCRQSLADDDVQFVKGSGYPDVVTEGGDFRDRLALVPGGEGGEPQGRRKAF